MEQQVLDLLVSTLDASGPIRNQAERQLDSLYTNDAFPVSLISIASHKSVPLNHRQAALLNLKKLVLKIWSPSLEEYEGPGTVADPVKEQVRQSVLAIATGKDEERKIVAAASYVVGKIASADFPEQWPSLLSTVLSLVPQADVSQLYGVLIVLSNLVEDGLDEEQFSGIAVELVNCLHNVAVDGQKKSMTRALAISIFRACFDTMELIYQTNPDSVQQFMQQASDLWTPLFLDIVKLPLPHMPSEEETEGSRSEWQGVIALKTQVVKVIGILRCDRIVLMLMVGFRKNIEPVPSVTGRTLHRPLWRRMGCSGDASDAVSCAVHGRRDDPKQTRGFRPFATHLGFPCHRRVGLSAYPSGYSNYQA